MLEAMICQVFTHRVVGHKYKCVATAVCCCRYTIFAPLSGYLRDLSVKKDYSNAFYPFGGLLISATH